MVVAVTKSLEGIEQFRLVSDTGSEVNIIKFAEGSERLGLVTYESTNGSGGFDYIYSREDVCRHISDLSHVEQLTPADKSEVLRYLTTFIRTALPTTKDVVWALQQALV